MTSWVKGNERACKLAGAASIERYKRKHGEGVHHICCQFKNDGTAESETLNHPIETWG
uniref:Uncharacterized protein n=1 Tax=Arion vulgaris TaxID=1028688 RepID=A0A0B7AXK1_9EUPU